ncbi:MAG: N-acetylmuramoyl-L-alanine amidase [Hyphomicrobiales bacterium]|jgi:N-acetylmuramoyl-L-alanine amidase
MTIVSHWIAGIPAKKLIHKGANQTPSMIVIHYSVTDTVADAVTALNAAKLSYHVLVEKDGTTYQTRRFTETAAHPGLSNWKARSGVTLGASVSRGSIGICLMNRGYDFGPGAPNAPGKLIYNPDDPSMQRWESYPASQIKACRNVVADIVANYPIAQVVGHHDVAILGKFDPGPLFDLSSLDKMITRPKPLGLRTTVTSRTLEVRRAPSSGGPVVETLDRNDIVHIRSIAYGPRGKCVHPSPPSLKRYLTRWASIAVGDLDHHVGFVDMKHLAATPLAPALAAHL